MSLYYIMWEDSCLPSWSASCQFAIRILWNIFCSAPDTLSQWRVESGGWGEVRSLSPRVSAPPPSQNINTLSAHCSVFGPVKLIQKNGAKRENSVRPLLLLHISCGVWETEHQISEEEGDKIWSRNWKETHWSFQRKWHGFSLQWGNNSVSLSLIFKPIQYHWY